MNSESDEFTNDPVPPPDEEAPWLSGTPVEPHEVVDVGVDPRVPWPERHGLAKLKRALQLQGRAFVHRRGARDEARREIRDALREAASATYWLEDTKHLTNAHFVLHQIGRFAHSAFAEDCTLQWTGREYEHTCPVRIAHKRFGVSPEMVVLQVTCSLCGSDMSQCDHLHEHVYRVRGGAPGSPSGRCRVCTKTECDHGPATTYLATPTEIISKIEKVDGIAFVSRPVQPDARLGSLPVSTSSLASQFGDDFKPGMKVSCHYCAGPCQGFDYLDLPQGDEPADVLSVVERTG